MRWIARIDGVLIDRVFQPISDMLAPVISCYGIASFLLTGACPLNVIASYQMGNIIAFMLALFWTPIVLLRAHQLDRSAPTNTQPADRIQYADLRLILVLLHTVYLPLDVQMFMDGHYWDVAQTASWWLIIVALYFMACRRNPPRSQTVFANA